MKELYLRFSRLFHEKFRINIKTRITLSQAAYEYWTRSVDNSELPIYLPTKDMDDFFRRAVYGGMSLPQKQYYRSCNYSDADVTVVKEKTNVDNDGHYLEEETEIECLYLRKEIANYLVDTDVVSLYPKAMKKKYPVGPVDLITSAEELEGVKMRLYKNALEDEKPQAFCIAEVSMEVPKNLVTPVLPRKGKKGTGIKWDLKPIVKQVYTSVDIFRALKKGYVLLDVHKAFTWRSQRKVFTAYVTELAELKKSSKKGTAMYAIAKLMLNALYGKTIMRPVLEKCAIVYNSEQIEKFRKDKSLTGVVLLDENEPNGVYQDCPAFIQGNMINEDRACNKPSYMGSFVLSWSRSIMDVGIDAIDGWKSLNNAFFYRDTDSSVVHSSQIHKLAPYFGKEFGNLDFDVQGKIVEYICIGPKAYLFLYQSKSGRLFYHKRCKGIPSSQWKRLTMNSFKDMLFRLKELEISDSSDFPYQMFRRVGGRVTSKLRENNVEPFSVRIEPAVRTLNRRKFIKRNRVLEEDEENSELVPRSDYGTLPKGFDDAALREQHEVYLDDVFTTACKCDVCKKLGYFE